MLHFVLSRLFGKEDFRSTLRGIRSTQTALNFKNMEDIELITNADIDGSGEK
ncbi:hypothetical protein [Mesorhizobium sp. WSM4904]|uniref:hypothetical protein n=1 Tax=Mesorhizobium sp. WSM4904 TaxID=3038545 RepID=UPI0024185A84|nr:hypothetical protein [Mesorhizobium sp. WSM4904]WFP65111.1 hypothetical protein QAZ47_11550 [Mesorhizobium sp. WSM4904]